jgi:putative transcriptional regulator
MESNGEKSGSAIPACHRGWGIQRRGIAANDVVRSAVLFLVSILLGLPLPSACRAQNKQDKAEFLVARRQIQDPFFEHSVVFMLPAPKTPLIVGLIINKPTHVTLGKLFPNTPEFKNRTEPAYFGGPVDVRIPSVVFRSPTAPEHAVQLYGNVYLTFDYDLISSVFQNSQQAAEPRMFLGRAQWAPDQLQNEIRQGSWYRVQADGDLIFSSQPNGLWRTLHDRAAPSKYIRYRLPSGGPLPAARNTAVM